MSGWSSASRPEWGNVALLFRLAGLRMKARCRSTLHRLASPRRLLASIMTVAFAVIYVWSGVAILSLRAPADPDRLRMWLSGGMVVYAIYHSVKVVWSNRAGAEQIELGQLTRSEWLWLEGGPVNSTEMILHQVISVLPQTIVKSLMICVVLAVDANQFVLLLAGVSSAMLTLEIVRLAISTAAMTLVGLVRRFLQIAISLIAISLAAQLVLGVLMNVPGDAPVTAYLSATFASLGVVTQGTVVQTLSTPWVAASSLALAEPNSSETVFYGFFTAMSLLGAISVLVSADRWARAKRAARERAVYHDLAVYDDLAVYHDLTAKRDGARSSIQNDGQYRVIQANVPGFAAKFAIGCFGWIARYDQHAFDLACRSAKTVSRYAATILISMLIPTVLCLSPLVTGRLHFQWLFVIGGVGLCTCLMAPPALRIDFRRDLKRMLLLKSLPVSSRSIVIGNLSVPIVITWMFQLTVLCVAGCVLSPGLGQFVMWSGMLMALAVFTFAVENSLFLTFPADERAQGIAMVLRTKLMFLGKFALLMACVSSLMLWVTFCRTHLSPAISGLACVSGAVVVTWSIAISAVGVTINCWNRFDIAALSVGDQ